MDFINELINKRFNTDKGYYYFVELIKAKYPTFNINEDNLKSLSIVELPEEYFYKTGFVGEYVATRNEIKILTSIESANYKFTEEELIETFLHELIHALTSKVLGGIVVEGLNQRKIETGENSYFLCLSEGITQFIVNDLLGKKSDAYPFATTLAAQLAIIIGKDNLIESYSKNNIEGFINSLKKVDKDFDERSLIVNSYVIHKVLNGELIINRNDLSESTIATELQKQLLGLYLKTECNSKREFLNSMFDEKLANEIAEQSIAKAKKPSITIQDIGFYGIEDVKKDFFGQINEQEIEGESMELVTYGNKKEEILAGGLSLAKETVMQIKNGKVINDVTDDLGERIVVTLTNRGTYGYQVFKSGETEPHYYAEGFYLIEDLKKTTDSNGRALRYESAKSRVQRNLIGCFSEYILDRGFHSFYINQKSAKDSEIQISQRMAGYDESDPVVLVGWNFENGKVSIVADAQTLEVNDKHIIRMGLGKVNDDGTIDFDLQYKMAMEAEAAKKFLGESSMGSDRLKTILRQSAEDAQSLLYGFYENLGLPIMEGVEPNNLLAEQASALLPESQGNKLN